MELHKRLSNIEQEIIDAICSIKVMPEGLLPHTVFVEETNGKGEAVYVKYQMIDMNPVEQNCIIYDQENNYQEEISLNAVSTDWLITIWNRYLELSGENEPEPKTLSVFLYPSERFERNATDEEIIADYETDEGLDPCVEKYTLDEFAAMLNNEGFINQNLYARFIIY